MSFSLELIKKLDTVEPGLRIVLFAMLEEIERHREQSVTRHDFADLRAEILENQKKTDQALDRLTEAQNRTEQSLQEFQHKTDAALDRLTEAQNRTEQSLQEFQRKTDAALDRHEQALDRLTAAQDRTEQALDRLTAAQDRGEQSMQEIRETLGILVRHDESSRSQIGGLSRSLAYSLENEAYRELPRFLATHGIQVKDRIIRGTIDGREINLLAPAVRDGEDVIVVGESVVRLDDNSKFGQLERHLQLAERHYKLPAIPVLVTHFAEPPQLKAAADQGIMVVQSFEWIQGA
ncbi:hypothetical protein Thiowin_00263 [Thiorhodovibrio winogradskyi]|uniref:Chromosome partition protein Smc n=1 Tax=Thiorhodovibrio winogradskyi TaxID=77007 RepID=A0ABZ0S474_9GAMM|nr:hypothetical protein [Thiorhodovibrio winogradskyi]